MKKQNRANTKSITLILVMLLILIALLIFIGFTYARYLSTATGTDEVTVASWSFKVNDEEIAIVDETGNPTAKTIDVDLFSTIKDTNGTSVEADTSSKLAPGTSGSFDLKVANTSDVTAEYGINLSVKDGSVAIPIEYKVGDGAWSSSLQSVATKQIAIGTTETTTVQWRWAYNESETENDTKIGIAARSGNSKVTVEASITANQVD